ncbi:MAG: hypothetical protein JWP81_2074 [Ferruginibacter sp.]|nr:hypothetical protein [Ferruginibacter sp.]
MGEIKGTEMNFLIKKMQHNNFYKTMNDSETC